MLSPIGCTVVIFFTLIMFYFLYELYIRFLAGQLLPVCRSKNMDNWTPKHIAPDDSMLQYGDYGMFLCYLPKEDLVSRYATRIYTKPHGWNDGSVSHWQQLPPEPL